MEFLSFRNFRQFERSRREIRLPYDLLNDLRFRSLPDAAKAHLLGLLLLAARMDNLLPNHTTELERLIGATEQMDLDALRDFIEVANVETPSYEDRAASRKVADSVRAAVLVRDGGRCRRCHRSINLEIDHIVPVSEGGKTEESNLQTLCRRCNRRKMEEAGSQVLRMKDGKELPSSIASELALLYLQELEPKVAGDSELLVATEAILSFAAIRHVDPPT